MVIVKSKFLPFLFGLNFLIPSILFGAYNGPLPDFDGDKDNLVMDYKSNQMLVPKIAGYSGFEFATPEPVDWNNDGLMDLIVGYNVKTPDSLRMFVFINQGSVGDPKFTGEAGENSCFIIKAVYPGTVVPRPFGGLGFHEGHMAHDWLGPNVHVIDWDGDGLFDIFMSEECHDTNVNRKRGAWLLINTGELGKPLFFKTAYLNDNPYWLGEPPSPYGAISPGEFQNLFLFEGKSSMGDYATGNLVDWNNDGIMDVTWAAAGGNLLLGAKNSAGGWKSASSAGTWISIAGIGEPNTEWGHHPKFAAGDFDGDGINELFVRDAQPGEVYLFTHPEGITDPAAYYVRERLIYSKATHGQTKWWHPKFQIFDFDEDGDPDFLAGWGGNGSPPEGFYLFRTSGGVAGSNPMFDLVDIKVMWGSVSMTSRLMTFPNPSKGSTQIQWNLPTERAEKGVGVSIYNVNGKLVQTLPPVFSNSVQWNGLDQFHREVSPGVYVIRLQTPNSIITHRQIITD